jgi:hypothetical protein
LHNKISIYILVNKLLLLGTRYAKSLFLHNEGVGDTLSVTNELSLDDDVKVHMYIVT